MLYDELMKDPWFRENATPVVEHTEWLEDEETVAMMKRVVDFLMKRAVEYKKMSEYKGDNPSEHVFKEFTDLVHKNLK